MSGESILRSVQDGIRFLKEYAGGGCCQFQFGSYSSLQCIWLMKGEALQVAETHEDEEERRNDHYFINYSKRRM